MHILEFIFACYQFPQETWYKVNKNKIWNSIRKALESWRYWRKWEPTVPSYNSQVSVRGNLSCKDKYFLQGLSSCYLRLTRLANSPNHVRLRRQQRHSISFLHSGRKSVMSVISCMISDSREVELGYCLGYVRCQENGFWAGLIWKESLENWTF